MSTEEDNPIDLIVEEAQAETLPQKNDDTSIQQQETLLAPGAQSPERSSRPGVLRQGGNMAIQVPTSADERAHVHETHGEDSWQARILHIIHTDFVEYLLMGLLILDVIILFIELYISAEFPPCTIIERDAISCCMATNATDAPVDDDHGRWLSGEIEHHDLCEEGAEADYQAACDSHKYPAVHTTHVTLRVTTVVILSIFMIELSILIAACGPRKFFSNFFYVLDLFVVSVSLTLEIVFLTLDESQVELIVGLLILARLWRFVRIGHGIFATTHELASKEHEHHKEYLKKVEKLCKENGIELPEKK
mmetsp:Transcript_33262/g.54909  ORF Transcript_33262/g.54909 Transcript_33262/m.54909 type:complete len:307 (+) Transcript_33262:85-1005(+)